MRQYREPARAATPKIANMYAARMADAWAMLAANTPTPSETASPYDKQLAETLVRLMELYAAGYRPRIIAVVEG